MLTLVNLMKKIHILFLPKINHLWDDMPQAVWVFSTTLMDLGIYSQDPFTSLKVGRFFVNKITSHYSQCPVFPHTLIIVQ